MSGLQVSPWKRYGHDRLYVNLPDGRKVAWFDRRTGELTLLVDGQRDAVLDALAPYVAGRTAGAAAGPPVSESQQVLLRPEDDLAANRPGEALLAKLDEVAPSFWRYLLAKLLGRQSEAESWRKGLTGERRAGERIYALARDRRIWMGA